MKHSKAHKLVYCGMLAALYVVLSLAFAPISFGQVQLRVSEALVLLPVFSPWAIVGVTAGCLLSNCIGVAMGLTLPPDILFGTLATLLAACLTYLARNVRVKGVPLLAVVPPVLCNAVIVGWEITYFFFPEGSPFLVYAANALWVGVGELIACGVLGLLLIRALERTGLSQKCGGAPAGSGDAPAGDPGGSRG